MSGNAGVPTKKRCPVVVSCPAFVSETTQQQRSGGTRQSKGDESAPKEDQHSDEVFISTLRVVDELGGASLRGQRKIEWEKKMLKKRGGATPPNQKVPLPILKGMRKKRERRELREREMAKEQDIVLPVSSFRSKKAKREIARKISRTKGDMTGRGLKASVGTYRRGTLFIPKKLIDSGGKLSEEKEVGSKRGRGGPKKDKGKKKKRGGLDGI